MIYNMMIEFTVGLVPVLGDAFDAVFKANTRNTELLRRYLYSELGEKTDTAFPWGVFILICAIVASIVILIVTLM